MTRGIWTTVFCASRDFAPSTEGRGLIGITPEQLAAYANTTTEKFIDGYAPFCKHLFVPNWTATPVAAIRITRANQHRLRSGYIARTPEERPVLERWFEGIAPSRARYLDVILYHRDQLAAEGDDVMDKGEWGIIKVIGMRHPTEQPMLPITVMRNALGIAEGGSGVALDHDAYARSVDFWSRHAYAR